MGYHYDHFAFVDQADPRATFDKVAESLSTKLSNVLVKNNTVSMTFGEWILYAIYCDSDYVIEESADIAKRYNRPQLAHCRARIEIHSLDDDRNMDYFNDVIHVLDIISKHEGIHIFDPVSGKFNWE